MKLRRLNLTNVRRFAGQTATLGPFGDGLTTITAENEAGKSTFFDALHAIFFLPHGSKAQEIRALQPYSGGAVRISAEIEVNNAPYLIDKTYLSQAAARIIDASTGQILKQQGDAEDWIESQINAQTKGPAGLLWVRQGDAAVDPDDKRGAANNVAARRDLMSSVRGQIDAITGGRRMDRIVERCRKEFDVLSTAALKPKAQGPWKLVADRVERLMAEKEKLTADVAKLSQALRVKTAAQKRLRQLQDPEQSARRAAQIAAAKAAFDHARHHAENIAKADQAVQLAEAALEKSAREIKAITDATARRTRRAAQISQTRKEVAQAGKDMIAAETALAETSAKLAENDTARRALMAELSAARKAEQQQATWQRLHQIEQLSRTLEVPLKRLATARTVLQGPPVTQDDITRLTDLNQQISIAREQRRVHFASVTLTPDTDQSVLNNGRPIAPGTPHLIETEMVLKLDGFGTVHLTPAQGAGREIADPEALRAEADALLVRLEFPTLAAARDAFAKRTAAQNDLQTAEAEIRGLAPEGIPALTAERERLSAEVGHAPGAQLPEHHASNAPQVAEIEAQISMLENAVETLKPRHDARQQAAAQAKSAEARAQGVLNHQLEEQALDPEIADTDVRLAALRTQHADALVAVGKATSEHDTLRADAPNLEAAQATLERLQSAAAADHAEIDSLKNDLARADGAIEAQSELAVEETLAEVTEKLATATQHSTRYAQQANALKLLIDHLDAARKAAQDTYFEPIRAELHPLLAQLHSNAAFELDPEKMLVGSITRDGVTDDVSVLSGGAAEQVAILTRLAFAKLFSRQNRHIPIILDDALVHTDDERITRMFDMLSRAAVDQQIIVLSCRTRAFSDLGGTRAFITVTD